MQCLESVRRGSALSVLSSFWMVCHVTVAAMAWAFFPFEIGLTDREYFLFKSVRPPQLPGHHCPDVHAGVPQVHPL